ncbi:MAG: DUF1858 domain-containing protein [Candidatus Izemoplasma sp.]|nr:DUF1858 domain-containing protein [Candidatus Izemoplasma sp.]
MRPLSANETIHRLVKQDNNLKVILHDIGFEEIVKPGMISTVGRFMTINKGCTMRDLDIIEVKEKLKQHDYLLVDID